jgi:LysR family transcriptional regulator, low CO2-responsive transcriptional regulator
MNLTLDTRQLQALVTLARVGSFTLAAEALFLTPSAVSHAIKELEQRVGCRLLDRRRKKVVPTQAGEQLLLHAERILTEMSAACSSLQEMGEWGKDRLRVGASATICQYVLPALLQGFYTKYPGSHITVEPADTAEAVELIRSNEIDLAIALEPKRERALEFHPLFTDELVFIFDPHHPWAAAPEQLPVRIPDQRYVLYHRTSYTFALTEHYFRKRGLPLRTIIEVGSMEAVKELARAGLGVGIVAPWVAARELKERSLLMLPLGTTKLKRNWGVICWRERRWSWAESSFLDLARAVTNRFATEPVS